MKIDKDAGTVTVPAGYLIVTDIRSYGGAFNGTTNRYHRVAPGPIFIPKGIYHAERGPGGGEEDAAVYLLAEGESCVVHRSYTINGSSNPGYEMVTLTNKGGRSVIDEDDAKAHQARIAAIFTGQKMEMNIEEITNAFRQWLRSFPHAGMPGWRHASTRRHLYSLAQGSGLPMREVDLVCHEIYRSVMREGREDIWYDDRARLISLVARIFGHLEMASGRSLTYEESLAETTSGYRSPFHHWRSLAERGERLRTVPPSDMQRGGARSIFQRLVEDRRGSLSRTEAMAAVRAALKERLGPVVDPIPEANHALS